MKIGLSLSRCVRDIVEKRVAIDDVLVVIARTRVDPTRQDHWDELWSGYNSSWDNPEWQGLEEDAVREVALELWNSGRIHQPRNFGAYPQRRPEFWLEAVLPSSELDRNPAAKAAWEHFQTVAGLSNVNLDDQYQ
jgi:hypothetical protein